MSNQGFFSISGVACVAHTPETKKIWQSISGCKSDYGREAIINYAEGLGFNPESIEPGASITKEALNFALKKFQGVFGAKSHIIREAIINY